MLAVLRYGLAIALFLTLSLFPTSPADAALCRQYHQHSICILNIKRSAKNYWQYQATLRIDGITQLKALYNCRRRTVTPESGITIGFDKDFTGEFICKFFEH
jgi:hypothetical protein